MDTPIPDVIKDSQASRPDVTPGSGNFGSPTATQHSWTALPRRRQVQQKAKASFLADDDEQDEDDFNDVVDESSDHRHNGLELDSTTPGRGSEQNRDPEEDRSMYAESPTHHASQAFRLPPQSAQPTHESNMSEASDESSVFEALKKRCTTTASSHAPSKNAEPPEQSKQKQKRALAMRGKTVTEGKKGEPARPTAARPKKVAGKSIANSKVKLSALEVEIETDTGDSDIQEPHDYNYSLPASNSSSPAAAPAKKKATGKKQPAKKPATKTKPSAPKAKPAAGGRAKNTKPAPASNHRSPETDPSERGNNEDVTLVEEHFSASEELHDARIATQTREEPLQPSKSATANTTQGIVTISSNSSDPFSESDDEDDEDFECPEIKNSSNTGRKTRATAQMKTAQEPNKHTAGHPAAVSNSPRHALEDEGGDLLAPKRSETLPKNLPPKKSAAENTKVAATRGKPRAGAVKDTMPSAERLQGKPVEESQATASRISKSKVQMKEAVAVPSNANLAEKGKANDLGQNGDLIKPTKHSDRKPNIVAFGPAGPKNNGKSSKTTATANTRPECEQADLGPKEHQTATMAQPHRSTQKSTKAKSKRTTQEDQSFPNGFVDDAEGRPRRAAKTTHPTIERMVPSSPHLLKMNTKKAAHDFDAEATGTTYEAERSDPSDQPVEVDTEADVVSEDAASVVSDSQDHPKTERATYFKEFHDEDMSNPLALVDPERPRMREQRTVLGDLGANSRNSLKAAPAVIPRPLKRKFPVITTVQASSPTRIFPPLGQNSAATSLPSEDHERFAKKPRYRSANPVRDDQEVNRTSDLAGRSSHIHRKTGGDSGDDIFGPGKEGESVRSSAFVQRLISQESAECGQDQATMAALGLPDGRAGTRQHPVGTSYSAAGQSAALEAFSRPHVGSESTDFEQRVLAALAPEKMQDVSPWPLVNDHRKRFGVGDDRNSWPTNPLDQERASDVDAQTRAWKKASEPYADSLGETMHKIVNVS